jgi:hypothetical protein
MSTGEHTAKMYTRQNGGTAQARDRNHGGDPSCTEVVSARNDASGAGDRRDNRRRGFVGRAYHAGN